MDEPEEQSHGGTALVLDTNGNGELNLPEYLRNWSRWARSDRQLGSLY